MSTKTMKKRPSADERILIAVKNKQLVAEFKSKLTPNPVTGCQHYGGFKNDDKYGRINGSMLAHRFAYVLAHGQLPAKGMVCSHLCMNRDCVNSTHIVVESQRDNILRSSAAGRMKGPSASPLKKDGRLAKGTKGFRKTISDAVIRRIKRALTKGQSTRSLAKKFGISQPYVSEIKNGKKRADVTI